MEIKKNNLQVINILLTVFYIFFSGKMYFSVDLGYGLKPIAALLLGLSIFSFFIAVIYLFKNGRQGKLIKIACLLNMLPAFSAFLYWVLAFLTTTLNSSVVYFFSNDDHIFLVIFMLAGFVSVVGVLVSFVLFIISFFKYKIGSSF